MDVGLENLSVLLVGTGCQAKCCEQRNTATQP